MSTSSFLNDLAKGDPVDPTAPSSQSDGESDKKKVKDTYSAVNVKVKPRNKIDYTQIYTANNYITTVRAFNEFLLKPK